MNDYISRQYLFDEYDRQHEGPPGGARKIIAQAPAADVAPYTLEKDDIKKTGRYFPEIVEVLRKMEKEE